MFINYGAIGIKKQEVKNYYYMDVNVGNLPNNLDKDHLKTFGVIISITIAQKSLFLSSIAV